MPRGITWLQVTCFQKDWLDDMLTAYLSFRAFFCNLKEFPHTVVHSFPAHIIAPETSKETLIYTRHFYPVPPASYIHTYIHVVCITSPAHESNSIAAAYCINFVYRVNHHHIHPRCMKEEKTISDLLISGALLATLHTKCWRKASLK